MREPFDAVTFRPDSEAATAMFVSIRIGWRPGRSDLIEA
jgi:hypothetical protein